MKKILLIEDDSNYIWHIKNFLQRKGYHVLVAFTVSQGKELIEKEQILIIGSDLKLSDGSGMELLEYLREKTYKIPFLFFTCYDKKYYEKEALEKGAKICMNKLQFDLVKETLLEYAYKESNGEGATFHKILLVKKNSEITSIIQTELLKKGIYEELKRLIQWNPDSEEKFLQKMVCLLLPGQRKCWSEAIRDLRQSFEAEQGMIFVEKYRGKLEWLNSISLAELQRKIGEIYFVDHYKMIADQFLYKKDFETSLFLRIAMETGIRSADIPCIEWSCMHGKTIILEETKRGDLYKKVNGTFPKISTQSLRIMKLLHRKQGKIFTKSNEYYVRKISCAWGMPGFRIHSFRDYRRKIEMGITAGVQVPRIIPL